MKITDKEIHGMAVSDSNEFFLQQLVSLDKNVHGNILDGLLLNYVRKNKNQVD